MADQDRILVTGGAGYIGSHACKLLAREGYLPVTYDNLITGHRDSVRFGPFVHGDILDQDRLRSVFMDVKPAAVMHFAACAYVGESVTLPSKYYQNNVVGLLNLLNVMRDVGCRSIVFLKFVCDLRHPKHIADRREQRL